MQNLLLTDSPSALLLLFPKPETHYLMSVDRVPYAIGVDSLLNNLKDGGGALFVLWLTEMPADLRSLIEKEGAVDLNAVVAATFSDIVELLSDENEPPPPERLQELADVIRQAREKNLIPDRFDKAYLFTDDDPDRPEFYRFRTFEEHFDGLLEDEFQNEA